MWSSLEPCTFMGCDVPSCGLIYHADRWRYLNEERGVLPVENVPHGGISPSLCALPLAPSAIPLPPLSSASSLHVCSPPLPLRGLYRPSTNTRGTRQVLCRCEKPRGSSLVTENSEILRDETIHPRQPPYTTRTRRSAIPFYVHFPIHSASRPHRGL